MPSSTHLYFSLIWICLCYAWITIHAALGVVAFFLERKVQRTESSLSELQDEDMQGRWDAVGRISGYEELVGGAPTYGEGLSPAQIRALPSKTALAADSADSDSGLILGARECSICLNQFEPGDVYRSLPGCAHVFHRSCIDLWLFRRAECPLCKALVHS